MPDSTTVYSRLLPIFDDLKSEDNYQTRKPLLAHYSTMFVLEQILKNNEIWFSNPLLMNDVQETTVALNEGMQAYLSSSVVRKAFLTAEDSDRFEREMIAVHQRFFSQHAFDTYILCLCEHPPSDLDGRLSMWRGYGDSGKGVAIVFDGSGIPVVPTSPLLLSKIWYATPRERAVWYDASAARFAAIVTTHRFAGAEIASAAEILFARLRLFSLFTKHKGFEEEQEWRFAYLPERDFSGLLKPYLGYHNGPRGVEPKLKLKFESGPAFGDVDVSMETLIHRIIVGPNRASPLAELSSQRMLDSLGRADLSGRLVASTIPYRQ